MEYYPIYVDLKEKKVVVVGGGKVAQRKITTLLKYKASVYIVSHELTPLLHEYVQGGKIQLVGKIFTRDLLDEASLVIAATDNPEINKLISEAAKEKKIFVNAVDQPADCSFIVPSIIQKGDLTIAISTGGKSPAFAQKLRKELDNQFGEEHVRFLDLMGKIREKILSENESEKINKKIFHELVDSPILDAIRNQDWDKVTSNLSRILGTRFSLDEIIHLIKDE